MFINKHGFRALFATDMLADIGEHGDILIKYSEDNFVSDYWNLQIEAAFMPERLTDNERIKYNEIRPVRMAPNFEHVGFKSFEAWHVDEHVAKTSEDKIEKWHNLAKVFEVPLVRAAGLDDKLETSKAGPRMAELIDPYVAAKTWGREKTRKGSIRKLLLLAKISGDPWPVEITTKGVRDAIEKHISEVKAKKGAPPSLAMLESLRFSGVQFMRTMKRKGHTENNPFIDADFKDLGANGIVKSYRLFDKDELHNLFALEMPAEDRLLLSILTVTGMRLDEAALLTWDQVKSEDGIKYLLLLDSENSDVAVKNKGSMRNIPLPDVLKLPERGIGRLFNYTLMDDRKTNASKFLMKHVTKVTIMETKVVHSLRDSLKDLLRDADVAKKLNDYIAGHSSGDVVGKYGDGFSLQKRYEAINSVKHPWLA